MKQKHPMQLCFQFGEYLHETLINYNFKSGEALNLLSISEFWLQTVAMLYGNIVKTKIIKIYTKTNFNGLNLKNLVIVISRCK